VGERDGVVEGSENTGERVGWLMVGVCVGMNTGLSEGAAHDPPPHAQQACAAVKPYLTTPSSQSSVSRLMKAHVNRPTPPLTSKSSDQIPLGALGGFKSIQVHDGLPDGLAIGCSDGSDVG